MMEMSEIETGRKIRLRLLFIVEEIIDDDVNNVVVVVVLNTVVCRVVVVVDDRVGRNFAVDGGGGFQRGCKKYMRKKNSSYKI